jgi:lysophospholipase L1-like esterase
MRLPGKLLLLVVASLLSFAAGELVLRLAFPAPWLYPLDVPEDALMIPDPQLGYALRPAAAEQWTRAHWSVRIEINADGLRDTPLHLARSASLRALAVGDSFTFGIGVEHGEAWPEVLERELAQRTGESTAVVNAGVPGYSARQMRLRALDLLEPVEPALVVAALYARSYWRVKEPYAVFGGALVQSAELPRLAIAASGDLIVTPFRPGVLRDVDIWLKGHLHLPARIFDAIGIRLGPELTIPYLSPDRSQWTDRDYQPVLDELTQLHTALAERGIPLVLLLVNHQDADGRFSPDEFRYNEHVTRFCRARDLPLADPLARFAAEGKGRPVFRTPSDMHWTPLAHQIAAEEVMSVIEARHLLPRHAPAAS